MPSPRTETASTARTIPIGPRVARILAIAHRSRRPALLVGPPGVGKSELVAQVAKALGIACITIDLSLCEPSDLVGLPRLDGDRTVFLPPAFLPRDGEGLIVFEELNRAERFVQGPVLQLLSARRLNSYVLPDGWTCVAAINPDDGQHDVRALDPAMLSRFLVVPVRADRREWLGWARQNRVHPAVVHVVETNAEALDHTPPRSWTYASDVLLRMTADERRDRALLHDTLAGFLPDAWAVILAEALERLRGGDLVAVDLLARCAHEPELRERLEALRSSGRTDVLRSLATDIQEALRSPVDLSRLVAQQGFTLASFEAVLERLPGDLREPCQEVLAQNAAAPRLLDINFADLLSHAYQGRRYDRQLCQWQREETQRHRARLFVAGLCAFLRTGADLQLLRRSNAGRRVLGHVLADLRDDLREQLLDCLASLMVEPILTDKKSR